MPPQNNPAPVPNAPVPPPPPMPNQAPNVPPSPGSGFNPDTLTKNPRFMQTVKIFAIYTPILAVINFVVSIVTSSFRYGFYASFFSVSALIFAVIYGVIGGAIGGAVFYFLFEPVHNWIKRSAFLSKYIHSMFTLFWIPSLVGWIISGIFGLLGLMALSSVAIGIAGAYGAASIGGAFIAVIIAFVVNLIVYYFYSKVISAKLEPLYPW